MTSRICVKPLNTKRPGVAESLEKCSIEESLKITRNEASLLAAILNLIRKVSDWIKRGLHNF